jgi:type II secretory pathway pseudopilin PulG
MNRFRKRAYDRKSEQGSTLVESVIAVAILGIVGVAALAAMATLVSSGDRSRRALRANAAAQTAADAIASKTTPYVACNPTASYQGVVAAIGSPAIPLDVTVTVSSVQYLQGTSFQGTCPSTVEGDSRRVQQIVVTAASARAARTVTFVKREP